MPNAEKPPKAQQDAAEPFGAGLGSDFIPLDARVVIAPGKNQVKLKRRKVVKGEEGMPSSKPEPEGP